tara:strand:- start:18 stop:254 length:237 start_codon:yes stop_codon:yes gene_type:complete
VTNTTSVAVGVRVGAQRIERASAGAQAKAVTWAPQLHLRLTFELRHGCVHQREKRSGDNDHDLNCIPRSPQAIVLVHH